MIHTANLRVHGDGHSVNDNDSSSDEEVSSEGEYARSLRFDDGDTTDSEIDDDNDGRDDDDQCSDYVFN
jgi:hypothetical protein